MWETDSSIQVTKERGDRPRFGFFEQVVTKIERKFGDGAIKKVSRGNSPLGPAKQITFNSNIAMEVKNFLEDAYPDK